MLDGSSLARAAVEETWRRFLLPISAIVLFLILTVGAWILRSHFEAKAYERITGQSVSTWDAMWVELRVQAGPKD